MVRSANTFFLRTFLCGLALLVIQCNSIEDINSGQEEVVLLVEDTIIVALDAGERDVYVFSQGAVWEAVQEGDPTWIAKLEKISERTLRIGYQANEGSGSRHAVISVTAGDKAAKIILSQSNTKNQFISLGHQEIVLPFSDSTFTFLISDTLSTWHVNGNNSWLRGEKVEDSLRISASLNRGKERTGSLLVSGASGGGVAAEITITQAHFVTTFDVARNEVTFPAVVPSDKTERIRVSANVESTVTLTEAVPPLDKDNPWLSGFDKTGHSYDVKLSVTENDTKVERTATLTVTTNPKKTEITRPQDTVVRTETITIIQSAVPSTPEESKKSLEKLHKDIGDQIRSRNLVELKNLVGALLRQHSDNDDAINFAPAKGWTVLITAINLPWHEGIEYLLTIPTIDVNLKGSDGFPPLQAAVRLAVESDAVAIIAELAKAPGLKINSVAQNDNRGYTPLLTAINYRAVEIVKALLNIPGIDVNSKGGPHPSGPGSVFSPLQTAVGLAESDAVAIIAELAKAPGLTVNSDVQHDNRGYTPLLNAIESNKLEVIKALLNIPAIDINSHGGSRYTPLQTVVRILALSESDAVAIIEELAKVPNLAPNGTGNFGQTPLVIAIQYGRVEIIKALLKIPGINVNAKGESLHSITPLQTAAKLLTLSESDAVAIIVELAKVSSLDPNKKRAGGWSPLRWAVSRGRASVTTELLRISGIEVSSSLRAVLSEVVHQEDAVLLAAELLAIKLLINHANAGLNDCINGKTHLTYVNTFLDTAPGKQEIISLLIAAGALEDVDCS